MSRKAFWRYILASDTVCVRRILSLLVVSFLSGSRFFFSSDFRFIRLLVLSFPRAHGGPFSLSPLAAVNHLGACAGQWLASGSFLCEFAAMMPRQFTIAASVG